MTNDDVFQERMQLDVFDVRNSSTKVHVSPQRSMRKSSERMMSSQEIWAQYMTSVSDRWTVSQPARCIDRQTDRQIDGRTHMQTIAQKKFRMHACMPAAITVDMDCVSVDFQKAQRSSTHAGIFPLCAQAVVCVV